MAQDIRTLQGLLPSFKDTGFLTNFARITQPITDFIRGNPILSTAAVGIGTTGLIAGATTFIRKRRKAKVKKRKKAVRKRRVSVRKKKVSRRRRVSHAKPRHKGHKRVAFTTKTGQKVSFLVRRSTSPRHKPRSRVTIRRSRLR